MLPLELTRVKRGTGFGTVMADFDLDGNIDLALVNGRVNPPRARAWRGNGTVSRRPWRLLGLVYRA